MASNVEKAIKANENGPLEKLLSSGESTEENYKEKLLHFAVGYGRKEAVQILLDAKADPNWQSLDGRNALHECCISGGGVEVVKMILDNGVDSSARGFHGVRKRTAVEMAKERDLTDHAEAILAHNPIANDWTTPERKGTGPLEANRLIFDPKAPGGPEWKGA